jgi:hypothetical protein
MHRARAARPRGFDSLPSRSDVRTLSFRVTVQLGTRVLTNFEINLAPSLLNFVRQAVPVPLLFLNYYRPGLLFTDFGDAKTLVRWTHNHIGLLLSLRCWVTCQCPALDSLLGFFYSEDGVVSHLQGFPTFRVLASTRVSGYPNTYADIKQKYQNGNIHRKLRVAN